MCQNATFLVISSNTPVQTVGVNLSIKPQFFRREENFYLGWLNISWLQLTVNVMQVVMLEQAKVSENVTEK